MKLIIKSNTFAKKTTQQAKFLSEADKKFIEREKTFEILEAKLQNNHYFCTLKKPIKDTKKWFFYKNHVVITNLGNQVNNQVPHHDQRNNKYYPSSTCNLTSVAMVLNFFNKENRHQPHLQLEDELFIESRKIGDRRYHWVLSKIMKDNGLKNRFSTETSWQSVKAHLLKGNPVIMSGKFTRSGHILVLRGFDDKGFFVNDPWGEWYPWAGGRYGVYRATSGENLHYSYRAIYKASYGGSKSTWAHLPSLG